MTFKFACIHNAGSLGQACPQLTLRSFIQALDRCLAMFGHVWPCLAMFGHVWPCLAMFGHVWPCLAMFGQIRPITI